MATTAPTQRRKPGRKPKHEGGARDRRAGTTLNDVELEQHRAWLKSKGWPAKAESDIVRDALAEQWAQAGAAA
jgi:hypothetical protein